MIRRPPRYTLLPYPTLFGSDFSGRGLNLQEAGSKIVTATKADTTASALGTPQLTADSDPFVISPDVVSASKSTIALSPRSEEHTSELQSRQYLVCRLLLEKK